MTTYFSDLMFFFVSNSRYALHNECFGQIPDKRGCAILYCFVILITIRQRSSNQHKMLIVKSSWRIFLYTMLAYFRTSYDTLWIRKKESPSPFSRTDSISWEFFTCINMRKLRFHGIFLKNSKNLLKMEKSSIIFFV